MKGLILLKSTSILVLFFFSIIGIILIAEIFIDWAIYLIIIQLFLIVWFVINIKLIENYLNTKFKEFDEIRSYAREDAKEIKPLRDIEYYIKQQENEIKKQELGLKNIAKFIKLHEDEINNENI